MNSQKQSGMTLVEMTTVLVALVALSAIVVPYVAGTGQRASCQTTDVTLITVKEAIMGGGSGPGYYSDLLGHFPGRKNTQEFNLNYLADAGDYPDFNPNTANGWRGPYISNMVTLSSEQLNDLDASFADSVIDPISGSDEVKTVHVNHRDNSKHYRYVLDAWGRPIVLQVPDDDNVNGNLNCGNQLCARIVSAGPNGLLETPLTANDENNNHYESAETRNDDRVLFLRIADPHPAGNQVCQ